MQTTLDIRMMRDDTRWTAVATIRSSALKGPIDLHASGDVRDLARAVRASTGAEVASVSSRVRDRVRRQIMANSQNFFKGFITNPTLVARIGAMSAASDLVVAARGGDKRTERVINQIFAKAMRGDAKSGASAQLILESAGLVDTGRASFKTGFIPMMTHRRADAPMFLLEQGPWPGDEKHPLNKWGFAIGADRSGHEAMSGRRRSVTEDLNTLALDAHYDPWNYAPYPEDTRGGNLFDAFLPPYAGH